jgi:peptide/nickel transport system permease protein
VGLYIIRRLLQAALTILGVMLLTFLLFRGVAGGDIAAAHVGAKATEQQRADWLHRHGYDRPLLLNVHRRLVIVDTSSPPADVGAAPATTARAPTATRPAATRPAATRPTTTAPAATQPAAGEADEAEAPTVGGPLEAEDRGGSIAADALALIPSDESKHALMGRYVALLSRGTSVEGLTDDRGLLAEGKAAGEIVFSLADGGTLAIDVAGVTTCSELIDRINRHPGSAGRLRARISSWSPAHLLRSQFADHLVTSVTFGSRSLTTNKRLTAIIAERAPRSLALMIPATVIGWVLAMIVSCFVAYYRGTAVDRVGVFLSVLGMCIPFLAFMIYGQWLMFAIFPARAYGLFYRSNIYVPILIMVVAGLGASVRFYRTVILDEVSRDYVRTARAKGLPLTSVLFKHVLRNCMLPILTQLILTLPFLIMGSLLVERYFGIPGLGDLMLTSINGRDEPIMNGLVFLTALIYTVGVLITDVSYAVFDPRIRLR